MAEQDLQGAQGQAESVGARLRLARAAAGLSRADIAGRTKIAERHLVSIEGDNFADLASSTYAVGFSRAYARAVGLDEADIARAVREQMGMIDNAGEAPPAPAFEPGDPARIPGSRTAWLAALGVVVVVALVFTFWKSYYSPAVSLPDLAEEPGAASTVAATAAPVAAAAAPAAPAPVVFTALEQGVWVKFYDAAGQQLMQKEMALGESYTVPAQAAGPMLRTARPHALRITVGGREVPPLADHQRSVVDVPVTAAALLARPAAPAGSEARAPQPSVVPSAPAGAASVIPPRLAPAAATPAGEPRAARVAEPAKMMQPPAASTPVPEPAPAAPPAEVSTVPQ